VSHAELDDERSFLLDSLDDLERERAAGDLSDADYTLLRDRYTRRAAEVLQALQRVETTDPSARPGVHGAQPLSDGAAPRVRRRTLAVVGTLALAAAAITLVVTQSGARLPGQSATGSVSLSRAAQLRRTLAQAETLEAAGNGSGALRLYQQMLGQDPANGEALAESGWLEFEAGVKAKDSAVLARAQQSEQAALRAEPGAYAPHLYLGSMLLAEGDATGAVGQYRQFLADGPPPAEVRIAQTFVDEAFQKAGEPVPPPPA